MGGVLGNNILNVQSMGGLYKQVGVPEFDEISRGEAETLV